MNNNMPEGFRIIEAGYIDSKESLMSSIGVASYEVWVETNIKTSKEDLQERIEVFLKRDFIKVEKESKGKVKDVEIRPNIFEFVLIDYNEREICFLMTLSAGSNSNLKPELVIKAFKMGNEIGLDVSRIHRTALYGSGRSELLF